MKNKILTFLSCASIIASSGLSVAFVVNPGLAKAYASPGKPTGYVNDYANVIPDDRQAALESDLQSFRDTTSNEVVVVTIQTLGGDSKENFANELAREWAIGGKANGNGVLLLIAIDERQIRIEVSQHLEGAITDLMSARIASNDIAPRFRDGDYPGGIEAGVTKLKLAAQGEYNIPAASTKSSSYASLFDGPLFFGFFILVWLSSFLARSKSIVAGGIIGLLLGVVGCFVLSGVVLKVIGAVTAPLLGLGLDWLVSRNYRRHVDNGGKGGFFGTWGGFSGGGGSGGGFGGFGGGGSFGGGGGGSSW